jgi:hypothetical protein
MRFNHKLYLLPLAILCLFASCKKDLTSFIGGNLQPEDEFIFAMFSHDHESLRLISYTIEDIPEVTSGRSFYALGSYKDETFGTIKVDLISQIYETLTWDSVPADFALDFDLNLIDSVVMYLPYGNAYPFEEHTPLDPFMISIGELAKPVLIDSATQDRVYYSNDNRSGPDGSPGFESGSVLSHWRVEPNLRDSIVDWESDTTGQTKVRALNLRIPLYTDDNRNFNGRDYARKLLQTSARNLEMSVNDLAEPSFLREITGLYIESHSEMLTGRGNILNFDFSGSNNAYPGIVVYYKKTEEDTVSASKRYDIGFWGAMTYNYVHIDRSTASPNLTMQIDKIDTTKGQDMLFLQSFYSTMFRVEMPDIRGFANIIDTNTQRLVINQASLVLATSPNGSNGRFSPAPSLGIARVETVDTTINEKETTILSVRTLPEIATSGTYNSNKGEYRIILTRHIQNLLLKSNDDAENFPLTIYSTNRYNVPDITSIHGPNAEGNKRMRLEIIYSVLPR